MEENIIIGETERALETRKYESGQIHACMGSSTGISQ